jgi:hypothetical protein
MKGRINELDGCLAFYELGTAQPQLVAYAAYVILERSLKSIP